MKKLRVICIIPARGGSKGLKLKNLRKVNGKPLIYYPINAAIKSEVCDAVFVSTDSKKIADSAKRFGAEVPFLRKAKFSKDLTTTETTLQNALVEYEDYIGKKFDICVFLTCTNIFRKVEWIRFAVQQLKKNYRLDSVFSVHHLYKHFWHYKKNKPKKVLSWMREYTSRQIAPKLFREDTGLTCATRASFWRKGKRIGNNVKFIINKDTITGLDIHNEMDLELAKAAIKYLKRKKIKYF